MHPSEFYYSNARTLPTGAADAVPANATSSGVFHLRSGPFDSRGNPHKAETYDSLLLLSTVACTYEVLYWNRRAAVPNWVVASTGTFVANTPVLVPFPYEAAHVYIRKTSATGSDGFLFCQPKQAGTLAAASVIVTGLTQIEDTQHVSGAAGEFMLAVRNDYALTTMTNANGDYSGLVTDDKGQLFVRSLAAAPTSTLGNYSTAVGNGTAVRLGDTTVTFTATGVVSNQLRKVIVSVAPGLDVTWEQGVNATLTLSGTTLTVVPANGAAAPVPAGTTVVVEWVGEVKGYDPSLQANRVQPISSDRSFRQPGVQLIAASQTITVNWADLGPEVLVDGSNSVGLYVNVDVNDSVNVRFRALAKLTNGGAIEYMLPTKVVNSTATPWLVQAEGNQFEWNLDTDFAVLIPFGLENIVQYVQFQVMCASITGAPGTAGLVLNADYTQGW